MFSSSEQKYQLKILQDLNTKRILLIHPQPSDYNGSMLPLLLSRVVETRYFYRVIAVDFNVVNYYDYIFSMPNLLSKPLSLEPKEEQERIINLMEYIKELDEIWKTVYFYIKGVRQNISGGLPDQGILDIANLDKMQHMYARVKEIPLAEARNECRFFYESYLSEVIKTEEIRLTVIKEIQRATTLDLLLEYKEKLTNRLTIDSGW